MRSHIPGKVILITGAFAASAALAAPEPQDTLRYTATSGAKSNSITVYSQTGKPYFLRLDRYHGIDDQVILLELVLTRPDEITNLLVPKGHTHGLKSFDFVATDLPRNTTRTYSLPELNLRFQVTVKRFHTKGDCKPETAEDCTLKDLELRVTALR